MISTFLTPIFREDVKCFGDDTCYSLAFGVPAALMGIATILLVLGKKLYVMKPPEGNIMTKVIGSIYVSVLLDRGLLINSKYVKPEAGTDHLFIGCLGICLTMKLMMLCYVLDSYCCRNFEVDFYLNFSTL